MGTNPLQPFVTNIQGVLSGVGLAVATCFLIWGAYQYMAASGNPRAMERGKSSMIGALAGYAIVIGANVITTLIQTAVTAAGGTGH
jgi:hypothetical protein